MARMSRPRFPGVMGVPPMSSSALDFSPQVISILDLRTRPNPASSAQSADPPPSGHILPSLSVLESDRSESAPSPRNGPEKLGLGRPLAPGRGAVTRCAPDEWIDPGEGRNGCRVSKKPLSASKIEMAAEFLTHLREAVDRNGCRVSKKPPAASRIEMAADFLTHLREAVDRNGCRVPKKPPASGGIQAGLQPAPLCTLVRQGWPLACNTVLGALFCSARFSAAFIATVPRRPPTPTPQNLFPCPRAPIRDNRTAGGHPESVDLAGPPPVASRATGGRNAIGPAPVQPPEPQ